MKRRNFVKVLGAAAVASWIARFPRASSAAGRFDPSFGSAQEALRAMQEGAISSRELTAHVFERIRRHNSQINAFITLLEDSARARAQQADEARARGEIWGRLHGLPILIKDSFMTAGVRTTCGSKTLESFIPEHDAIAVARLKAAGAILIGKTNLPEFAGDLQSYNAVAGTTNNPWDVSRTPGGSTGGGAAALAAGFGFLELGSDIGGSIRTPVHFCGIYGHKPTLNLVPTEGHVPPPPGTLQDAPDLNVAGPMARAAQDILLELQTVGGPAPSQAGVFHWSMPSARASRLRDYRIGYVTDDPFCPVGGDVKSVLTRAIEALGKAGVELREGWPAGYRPQEGWDTYFRLLAAVVGPGLTSEQIRPLRESSGKPWAVYAKPWLEGMNATHPAWMGLTTGRLRARAIWQEYFKTHDAFLMPVNIVPAFPHNHKLTFFERTVSTPERERQYADMLKWISPGSLTGCPVTVAPAGRVTRGLPVGLQILGPYLEDATPIDIAGRMADVLGGFERPPAVAG